MGKKAVFFPVPKKKTALKVKQTRNSWNRIARSLVCPYILVDPNYIVIEYPPSHRSIVYSSHTAQWGGGGVSSGIKREGWIPSCLVGESWNLLWQDFYPLNKYLVLR